MEQTASPDRITLAAFAGAVLIGGSNFVAVKVSNSELDPLFGAAFRFGAAALIMFAIARWRRMPLPRGRAAVGAIVYGILGIGVSYAGLYYALTGLTAGTTSVIGAAVPLMTLVLAVAHGQEKFTLRGALGGTLAVAGIAILSGGSFGADLSMMHVGAALVGLLAVAESSVVVKGFPRAHPVTTNAVGMAAGALLLAAGSLAFGETWALPSEPGTWLAYSWLVVAGSCGLFALFLFVIKRWTASATTYVLTLMPVVAVTLGIVLLDEQLRVQTIIGGVVVLAAVYVGALSKPRMAGPKAAPVLAEATGGGSL